MFNCSTCPSLTHAVSLNSQWSVAWSMTSCWMLAWPTVALRHRPLTRAVALPRFCNDEVCYRFSILWWSPVCRDEAACFDACAHGALTRCTVETWATTLCLWVSHERIWGSSSSRYTNFLIIIIYYYLLFSAAFEVLLSTVLPHPFRE